MKINGGKRVAGDSQADKTGSNPVGDAKHFRGVTAHLLLLEPAVYKPLFTKCLMSRQLVGHFFFQQRIGCLS